MLTRWDPVLKFNWGWGSPAWEVPPDNFSAQWTRTFYMQGGTWRVTTTADDGVRVFVDGTPVIDEWKVSAATTYIRDIVLRTGYHTVTVQYFEAEGVAQVAVTPSSSARPGWQAFACDLTRVPGSLQSPRLRCCRGLSIGL